MKSIKINDVLIFNDFGWPEMTKGKSYKVTDYYYDEGNYWVDILNDFGRYDNFTDDLFITPSEYRSKIINEILK